MNERQEGFGLSDAGREQLLTRMRRGGGAAAPVPAVDHPVASDFADPQTHGQMEIVRTASEKLGIANPFFRVHEGIAGAQCRIDGKSYLNFSSYNYLGLNGHPEVSAAAHDAIVRYGTSASASRLVAGERPPHRALEEALARLHGTQDCISFVSGHATNVTVIGNLMGKSDLIVSDALSHNSIQQGAQLSGARRLTFPHNDVAAAERLLAGSRAQHKRALLVLEGHYSMDGDLPDLPAFIDLARRHRAMILVDEAHAVGVLGARGRGIAEHFGIDPSSVDLWMGTLSKTLAGCGGYIACRREIAEYLRYTAPGFVYSVGMPPPVAAASLAAVELLFAEPQRVKKLNDNAALFLKLARAAGFDTGLSQGFAIVPVILGSSIAAGRLSDALFQRGVNVQPILYPAVSERAARLRFFLSSAHEPAQIEQTVQVMAEEYARIQEQKVDLSALAEMLR